MLSIRNHHRDAAGSTLQDPDAGAIVFDGVDVVRNKAEIRRMLGYLPQDLGVLS